jgi:hypothetical protein
MTLKQFTQPDELDTESVYREVAEAAYYASREEHYPYEYIDPLAAKDTILAWTEANTDNPATAFTEIWDVYQSIRQTHSN